MGEARKRAPRRRVVQVNAMRTQRTEPYAYRLLLSCGHSRTGTVTDLRQLPEPGRLGTRTCRECGEGRKAR